MPKKHSRKVHYHKDIRKRRLRKALRDRLHRLSLREISFRTCEADPDDWEQDCLASPCSQGKVIKRGHFLNFAQSLEAPMSVHCVFSLYGMITIDESALQARAKDQSLIKSLFHFHSLTEVQAHPDYLLLRIRKNRDNPYPIPYIVARFKSHGDSYLHQMACKIEQIHLAFQQLPALPQPPTISDKLLQKYLQQKRGKRFMLRASPNCLVFSRELLELGGFGVEEVALECLSYRCFVSDIFLADDYRGQIDKFFELYELGKELRSGRLKQEEYLRHASQQQVEYIATAHQTLLTVRTEKTNLLPGLGCWEVREVLRQEQIAPSRSRLAQGREYQQRTLLRQMPTLSQLTKVGKNLSSFNRGLVCSHTTVPAL